MILNMYAFFFMFLFCIQYIYKIILFFPYNLYIMKYIHYRTRFQVYGCGFFYYSIRGIRYV